MRLDKFLKVSRLIKRRTVANSVSEMGKVYVNGNIAKPAKQLKAGDIIKQSASYLLGSGGGRPNMANGRGKDKSKLSSLKEFVKGIIK